MTIQGINLIYLNFVSQSQLLPKLTAFYPQLDHQQQQSGSQHIHEGTQSARPAEHNDNALESNRDSPEPNLEVSGSNGKGVDNKHTDTKDKE